MAILGLDTCERLNLVKCITLVKKENPDITQEFSDCFGEIGTLPKIHHIHVNPEIKPWLPVAFANRAMTQTEQNYCQIEKETLSIVFGCEKFHQFVYGRQFEVENDHQPLKSIFD